MTRGTEAMMTGTKKTPVFRGFFIFKTRSTKPDYGARRDFSLAAWFLGMNRLPAALSRKD